MFNANAAEYIPVRCVKQASDRTLSHSSRRQLEGRTRVPTAKVPSYVKRVNADVRDTKPGLLPTPDIPPMSANLMGPMYWNDSVPDFVSYSRSISPGGDVYATPYAANRRTSTPSSFDSLMDSPSDGTSIRTPSIQHPPVVETGEGLAIDLVDTLLAMISSHTKEAQPQSTSCNNWTSYDNSLLNITSENSDSELLDTIAGYYLPSSTF